MWRANDILDEIFDDEESEEEQCGEEALLLSKKRGTLEMSSGGVKKQAKEKGKENLPRQRTVRNVYQKRSSQSANTDERQINPSASPKRRRSPV